MSTPYPGPVSAVEVGSYFVGQYYKVLRQQPDLAHQFYSEASSMIRIDGDKTESASTMLQIHTILMALDFTSIEIKTLNSLDSWNGCILVMVSGSVKVVSFGMKRNFVQTFVLAPQDKGYFVLNDIFQYILDEPRYKLPPYLQSESNYDSQLNVSSTPHPEPQVADYVLEEESREFETSAYVEDDQVDEHNYHEQHEEYQEGEPDIADEEETSADEISDSLQNVVLNVVQETAPVTAEEPVGEPQKKTWASILRVSKGQSASSTVTQPSFTSTQPSSTSAQTTSDWNHAPQYVEQPPSSTFSAVPDSAVEAAEESYGFDDEEEPKSVYVRNLSPDITEFEIEEEFKNFGRIKPDGVFIRSRKDIGVCYAFVEYEDLSSVHNALKASPIQVAGRQVYIEERRANSSGVARGGRGRGRGRGGYPSESTRGRFGGRSLGRGSNQDNDYNNRSRGNGFYQRGSR